MFEDEITIQLLKPINIGKGEGSLNYTELTLREPNAGELEKASRADTNVGSLITLISLITGKPRGAIEKLSRADLKAAEATIDSFTGGGQSTPTDGDG